MTVSIIYHTRFGNNTEVAQRISDRLESRGHGVSIHPISEAGTGEIPAADLYLAGSPTQIGTLPQKMARFVSTIEVKDGSFYAAFVTKVQAEATTAENLEAAMEARGARQVFPSLVLGVKDIYGPLEDGWESKCDAWTDELARLIQISSK